MSLFNSELETENFKNSLIQYFNLKQEHNVVTILHSSKLECVWYTHDNWNGGFDIYELYLEVPVDIYVKLEDKLTELANKINDAANKVITGNDHINDVYISIQHQVSDKDLLAVVEKLKVILILKATGKSINEEEYKSYRKILLDRQNLIKKIPLFIQYYANSDEFFTYIQPKCSTYQERREHISQQFEPLVSFLESSRLSPIHTATKDNLSKLNSETIHELWLKAADRLNGDPDGSITAASTLLEDTIKNILNELNIEYSDEKDKLPKLYGLLAKNLNLSPNQYIEEIFRQILGGCNSIIHGLGSLRNKIGDAHARGRCSAKPARRHAELAVNLAGTMATFLISTWEKKEKK